MTQIEADNDLFCRYCKKKIEDVNTPYFCEHDGLFCCRLCKARLRKPCDNMVNHSDYPVTIKIIKVAKPDSYYRERGLIP